MPNIKVGKNLVKMKGEYILTAVVNLMNGSSDVRDSYVAKVEILDKVKQLALLPDNEHMTLRQVADYYEIEVEVVRKTIQRHREELQSDGMMKLQGRQLDEFKAKLPFPVQELKKVPTTQLLPRRAILRMGMVLKNSKVAEKVRTYLLEAESLITAEQKRIIFQGSWTEAIDEYIIAAVKEGNEQGIRFNDTLKTISDEIHATTHQIKNYWYVGAQGKTALRHRINVPVVNNPEGTNVVNLPSVQQHIEQSVLNTTFPDLFAFGDVQEKERLLKEQNKLIGNLLDKVSNMEKRQSAILQENDDLKSMIKDIHAAMVKR